MTTNTTPPPHTYYQIKKTNDTLTITNPLRKRYDIIGAGIMVLLLSTFGSIALSRITYMSDFFPLILTMFWSVICLPIMLIGSIYILLWQFNGQEQIIVTPESITLQYEMFGRVRQATYSTTHITHFGTSNLLPASRTAPFLTRLRAAYGMEGGTLTFDYGSDTIHFGINLSEAEARQLIAEIKTTISPK